jgi:hypothetical protein
MNPSPLPESVASAIVERWCAIDRSHAFLPADRAAVEATRATRRLVVELLLRSPDDRDVMHALGVMGQTLADHGGSPTLAASIFDGLAAVVHPLPTTPEDADRSGPTAFAIAARAAVVESYVLAVRGAGHAEAVRGWEYPACAVPLADGRVAIACGCPDDDTEALEGWAAGVARAVRGSGATQVVAAGSEKATAALDSALELAGLARV